MDNKELDMQDVLKQEFITVEKAINDAYNNGQFERIPDLVDASIKIANVFSIKEIFNMEK